MYWYAAVELGRLTQSANLAADLCIVQLSTKQREAFSNKWHKTTKLCFVNLLLVEFAVFYFLLDVLNFSKCAKGRLGNYVCYIVLFWDDINTLIKSTVYLGI